MSEEIPVSPDYARFADWEEPPADPSQVMASFAAEEGADDDDPDVSAVCSYLGWNSARFAAYEQRYFAELTALLRENKVLGAAESVGRTTFRAKVKEFQKQAGLGADGLPGADTLWALHIPRWKDGPIGTAKVAADEMKAIGGVSSFEVRADVKAPYEAMRAELLDAGAVVVTGGALRSLNATVSAGRSATSFHYSGLAIDLAIESGMEWGGRDFWKYLVAKEDDRWRVFAAAPKAPQRQIEAVIWESAATRTKTLTGNFLDLTALAEKHGFASIRPRSGFPGEYLCAEWWHLQLDGGLVPGITPFGSELLKLTTKEKLETTPPWEYRTNIYHRLTSGKGWF